MSNKPHETINSRDLRLRLSETLNTVVFGKTAVIVTRRGRKIAGLVPFEDMAFLERMKLKKAEVLNRRPPENLEEIGAFIAQRVEDEMHYR